MYQFPQGELFPPGGQRKGDANFRTLFTSRAKGSFTKAKTYFAVLTVALLMRLASVAL